MNRHLFLKKILENTKDLALTDLNGVLLKDRRFYIVLNKQSRWQQQLNGLPQCGALAPLLYNIYTDNQLIDQKIERFIYVCVTSRESTFDAIEGNLTSAQVFSLYLRNWEANKPLNITWSGTPCERRTNTIYLVKLDRTLSYKEHVKNTQLKFNSRNNIFQLLTHSKWSTTEHTIRFTSLAMCYSSVEYACLVWQRSSHEGRPSIE